MNSRDFYIDQIKLNSFVIGGAGTGAITNVTYQDTINDITNINVCKPTGDFSNACVGPGMSAKCHQPDPATDVMSYAMPGGVFAALMCTLAQQSVGLLVCPSEHDDSLDLEKCKRNLSLIMGNRNNCGFNQSGFANCKTLNPVDLACYSYTICSKTCFVTGGDGGVITAPIL